MVTKKEYKVNVIKGRINWIEIELFDEEGKLVADAEYVVVLSDGSEIKGKLDENGYAKVNKINNDSCSIIFPKYENIMKLEEKK